MNELLRPIATAWWQWMLPLTVQAGLLVLIVGVVDRVLQRWSWPSFRAALWCVVLIKLLLPPTLTSPWSLTRLRRAATTAAIDAAATTLASSQAATLPLFLTWLSGVLVLAFTAARRYRTQRAQWLATPWTELPEPLAPSLHRAVRAIGLQRAPEVRVSALAKGPAVVGLLRPIVVLPAALVETALEDDAGRQQLEHVLLHELSHVRRRDPLTSTVVLGIQLLYWFHPAAWWARARLDELREMACDEAAARALSDAAAYRRTLLQQARPLLQSDGLGQLAFVHRHSQLLARLRWLERPLRRRSARARAFAAGVLLLLATCCVPLGLVRSLVLEPALAHALSVAPTPSDAPGCLHQRYVMFGLLGAETSEPVSQGELP
ncbi:MAG: M56 family metallopeptidase [Acidobacteriota bacterium]